MKILIEVPEEELKIYKRDRQIETLSPSDIKKFILSRYYNDIIDATIIPDNATNGDMIKALFDIREIEEMKHCVFVTIYPNYDTRFIKEWWNAPYKKGEKNDTTN